MTGQPLRPPPPPAGSGGPGWNQPSRLSGSRSLVVFIVAFVIVLVVAVIVIYAFAPRPVPPRCPDPNEICAPSTPRGGPQASGGSAGLPPPQQSDSPPLRTGATWTDPATNVQFDYDPQEWQLQNGTPSNMAVLFGGFGVVLRVEVAPSSQASPADLLKRLEDVTNQALEGVVPNTEDRNKPLHPQIGYVDAEWKYFSATSTSGGQITAFAVTLLASSDGTNTIGMLLAVPDPDQRIGPGSDAPRVHTYAGQKTDSVLKRVYWVPLTP